MGPEAPPIVRQHSNFLRDGGDLRRGTISPKKGQLFAQEFSFPKREDEEERGVLALTVPKAMSCMLLAPLPDSTPSTRASSLLRPTNTSGLTSSSIGRHPTAAICPDWYCTLSRWEGSTADPVRGRTARSVSTATALAAKFWRWRPGQGALPDVIRLQGMGKSVLGAALVYVEKAF